MNDVMSRRGFLGVSAAAIGGVLIGCGSDDSGSGGSSSGDLPKRIKIGGLAAVSGAAAAFGESALNSWRLAVDEWNDKGGVFGDGRGLIDLEIVDDRSTPEQAVEGMARLARDKDVLAVMGVEPSPATLQASTEAERQRMPYINVASLEATVNTRGLTHSISTSTTANVFLEEYVKGMRELLDAQGVKPQRVAFVYENQIVGPVYKRHWDKVGAKLVGDWNVVDAIGYNPTSQDLSPVVSRLKSARVDLPLMVSYVQDSILLVKAMKTLDYVPLAISGAAGGWETDEFADALRSDSNHVICAGYYSPDLDIEETRRFVKAYTDRYKTVPDGVAASAYNGAYALFGALQADRVGQRDGVLDAMRKVNLEIGKPGMIIPQGVKVTQTGANEAARPTLFQWMDGKKQALLPQEYATAKPKIPRPGWDALT
jgi:branched-chain amino acid transport system substrate-binding protein